MQTVLLQMQVR